MSLYPSLNEMMTENACPLPREAYYNGDTLSYESLDDFLKEFQQSNPNEKRSESHFDLNKIVGYDIERTDDTNDIEMRMAIFQRRKCKTILVSIERLTESDVQKIYSLLYYYGCDEKIDIISNLGISDADFYYNIFK